MKKWIESMLLLAFMLALTGCGKGVAGALPGVTFEAELLEIADSYYLVEPVEGSPELKSSDRITVSMSHLDLSSEPEVGDILEIEYNGEIAESYPAQIRKVYSIKVVREVNKEEGEAVKTNESNHEGENR